MKLQSRTKSFTGPEAYYEAAYLVLDESAHFAVAAKTPTLLLPQEQESMWRRKYFELVNRRIRAGLPTTYLFSEPETIQKLSELNKSQLSETLAAWREFVSLGTLKLGCLPDSNFKGMVFGDKHLAMPRKHPATGKSDGVTVYPLDAAGELAREFNRLEKRTAPINEAYVTTLERSLAQT